MGSLKFKSVVFDNIQKQSLAVGTEGLNAKIAGHQIVFFIEAWMVYVCLI